MTATDAVTVVQPEINLAYMSMRDASMSDRVSAAAAAGFNGIGLRPEEVFGLRARGWDNSRIRDLVAAHGIRVSEIEPLRIFRDDLLEMSVELARFFETPRIQVAPPFEPTLDFEAAASWLRKAADRLAPSVLAIEFIPTTGLADLPATDQLIEMINRPNVGSCVDAWHVFRGAGIESLAGLNPALVSVVQISDGAMTPALDDYIADCVRHRHPVGEGEFPLADFLSIMPASAPVSVEVISLELDALPPAQVARRLYETTYAAVVDR